MLRLTQEDNKCKEEPFDNHILVTIVKHTTIRIILDFVTVNLRHGFTKLTDKIHCEGDLQNNNKIFISLIMWSQDNKVDERLFNINYSFKGKQWIQIFHFKQKTWCVYRDIFLCFMSNVNVRRPMSMPVNQCQCLKTNVNVHRPMLI